MITKKLKLRLCQNTEKAVGGYCTEVSTRPCPRPIFSLSDGQYDTSTTLCSITRSVLSAVPRAGSQLEVAGSYPGRGVNLGGTRPPPPEFGVGGRQCIMSSQILTILSVFFPYLERQRNILYIVFISLTSNCHCTALTTR